MAGDQGSVQSLEHAVAHAGNPEAAVAFFGNLARIACSKYPELATTALIAQSEHLQSLISKELSKRSGNVLAGSGNTTFSGRGINSGRPGPAEPADSFIHPSRLSNIAFPEQTSKQSGTVLPTSSSNIANPATPVLGLLLAGSGLYVDTEVIILVEKSVVDKLRASMVARCEVYTAGKADNWPGVVLQGRNMAGFRLNFDLTDVDNGFVATLHRIFVADALNRAETLAKRLDGPLRLLLHWNSIEFPELMRAYEYREAAPYASTLEVLTADGLPAVPDTADEWPKYCWQVYMAAKARVNANVSAASP